jgi:tRNA A-37 threonylcarbamoyl transferase component Bud32
MKNIQPNQIPFLQKSVLLKHFHQYISKNMPLDNDSKITLCDIQRLDYSGTNSPAQSYLLKLIITRVDGSSECKKIVLKCLNQNFPIKGYDELQSKDFSMIQSVQIPKIIQIDVVSGYVLTEFLSGKEITHLLDEIINQGYIKNWQKKIFERIGQALAEIHIKLKIIHSDSRLVNWIYNSETDKISLIDWEWAGRGDPAWDLSRLIYDVGRRVSRLESPLGLKRTNEIYDIFDAIFLAIINGYAASSKNREIVRKSASFWIHHSFSVTTGMHEIIFHHCGFPLPKAFIFLRGLPDSILSNMMKEDQTFIRKIFRIFTQLSSLILLVSGKRKRKDISRAFKRLTQMFAREIKHMC